MDDAVVDVVREWRDAHIGMEAHMQPRRDLRLDL